VQYSAGLANPLSIAAFEFLIDCTTVTTGFMLQTKFPIIATEIPHHCKLVIEGT
jgi:hypothetical protein